MTPDITRILVPLDFSTSSHRALDYAHGFALKFGAALHLIHVCDMPAGPAPMIEAYADAYGDWNRIVAAEAETALTVAAATITDVKVTTQVLAGHVATRIVDAAANNKVDLIVMGTHGHGAMMHLLMGNVAERVVRAAACPVLTVREAKETHAESATPVRLAGVVASLVIVGALLAPAVAAAQEHQQTTAGSEVFKQYCVACHGTSARGDGPLASSMLRKPANLTEIAKRNGGQFPSELVFETIDGRRKVRGHGGPDMPEWAEAFSKSKEAGDAERVDAVIRSLVDYLGSIQLRPAHDQ